MHNIRYLVYKEKARRNSILSEIKDIAKGDGDNYHSNLTWHDTVEPLENYDKAKEFIQKKDNGWYDDHAVRYYDYSAASKTKKIEELEKKIDVLVDMSREYKDKHSIHNFKAKHIGCEKCGSKLNKEYIVGEKCPLCRHDLRGKTTLEKLEYYKNKIEECRNKIQAEKEKQKKKAEVMWLVKIEYHS